MHVRETVVVLFSNGLAPKCKELSSLELSAGGKDADRRTKQVFINRQIYRQTQREIHIERHTAFLIATVSRGKGRGQKNKAGNYKQRDRQVLII
jgi:hypothetical protein